MLITLWQTWGKQFFINGKCRPVRIFKASFWYAKRCTDIDLYRGFTVPKMRGNFVLTHCSCCWSILFCLLTVMITVITRDKSKVLKTILISKRYNLMHKTLKFFTFRFFLFVIIKKQNIFSTSFYRGFFAKKNSNFLVYFFL